MPLDLVDGKALMLAIDDHWLPFKRNLCYYLSKPDIRKQPVLAPSRDNPNAPDYQATHFYGTVLLDEGKYRMWHYAKAEEKPKPAESSLVCYAESSDGINWTKPNLGQVMFKGSRDNNIIKLIGQCQYGPNVIKDEEDPDPQRRYKMVYNPIQEKGEAADRWGQPISTIRTATSPDGIEWTVGADFPVDVFVEQGSFFKHEGLYIVHGQAIFYGGWEGGSNHGRQGYAWVSPDFDNWIQGSAQAFLLPEPADPALRGFDGQYDQVHIGVGAANFGSVQVGLYCLWHQEGAPPMHRGTNGDFGLVLSNDGIHFREPVKGHVYISRHESPVTPAEGRDHGYYGTEPYPTILCQYNGILNAGEETRIYHGRWRNAGVNEDYYAEVALATLPRDRWGALGLFPDESEGWVWSAPVTLPGGGCRLTLNADQAQMMRVEVSDERFNLLPGYSGGESGVAQVGDGLDSEVEWSGEGLSALGGRTVRVRVDVRRNGGPEPRLYAVNLASG